jgi:hypothetical protein
MAIDTANKRASVIGFALAFRLVAPTPDGSLASAADREQLAQSYAGIAADPPPNAPLDGFWIINTRRRRG